MAGILKRVVSVIFVSVFLYAPAFAAPPANPDIPADLLKEKMLQTYVNQMVQRGKYWRSELCQATSLENTASTCEEILKDYNLYNAVNYQREYARLTEALYLPILRGKLDMLKADDPLATAKLINIAVMFSKMNPAYMSRGFEDMLTNPNQAVCYIGWQGMKKNRNAEISASQLKALYSVAQDTLAKETNPNILSEAMQAIDFGTSATQSVPEQYRKVAATKTMELMMQNWKKFTADVSTADRGEKLVVAEVAASTLANNTALAGNEKQKKQALAMIFKEAQTAVEKFEKLQASIKAVKTKLDQIKTSLADPNVTGGMPAPAVDPNTGKPAAQPLTPEQKKLTLQMANLETLAGDYKVFLMNCEDALNTLTGATHDYIAKQMTATADPAAAMKIALLDWQSALNIDAK